MLTGIAEETPIEKARQQFDTNFWGTVKLTNALLPYFRKQRRGHIITLSSLVGIIGPPNLAYYSASKHALEGYFKSLRIELNQFNLKVSMVEPGWFKTNIGQNSIGSVGKIGDYQIFKRNVSAYMSESIKNAEDPIQVTRLIHKIMESKEPSFRNLIGKMSKTIFLLQNYAPKLFEKIMLKNVSVVNP